MDIEAPDPSTLRSVLVEHGSLAFHPGSSGMYPAVGESPGASDLGQMRMAWIRDNVHIANALLTVGEHKLATTVAKAIMSVYWARRDDLNGLIAGEMGPLDPRYRLPARVDPDTLLPDRDVSRNLQNDAVGYALWLIARCVAVDALHLEATDLECLGLVVRYLGVIQFWKDKECGHWEEAPKVNASSIGAVLAGLRALRDATRDEPCVAPAYLDELINRGANELQAILPYETRYPRTHTRRYDAAHLFLVEPLRVIEGDDARRVVNEVTRRLTRERGICRYPGDTYWGPDFRAKFAPDDRSAYAPGRLEAREASAVEIRRTRTEAQWSLFDPLLSVYWSRELSNSGAPRHRKHQLHHLQRSLDQLTVGRDGAWLLPEAYFLEQGRRVANDHVPLLWSQANLLLALHALEVA